MPLVVPFLIGGLSLLSGVAGAKKLQRARALRADANQVVQRCEAQWREENQACEAMHAKVCQAAARFDAQKERAFHETIGRVRELLSQMGQRARLPELESLTGVERTAMEVEPWNPASLPFQERIARWLQIAATGAFAHVAVTTLPSFVGVASTGAFIGGLSGAAARSAALAWLGGGALSAGGGGMAVGTVVGGAAVVGPVVLLVAAQQELAAEQLLTSAHEYCALVTDGYDELKYQNTLMSGIERRIIDLESACDALTSRVLEAMNTIDPSVWSEDNDEDLTRFSALMILVKTLMAVLQTPVIGPKNTTTERSETLILRYRKISGAAQ